MIERKPKMSEKLKAVKQFTSDGCTMAPDLVFKTCCEEHDMYYALGGVTRREADKRLRLCIKSKGYPVLAWVYWIAVRLFGWIPYHFSKSAKIRKEFNKLSKK